MTVRDEILKILKSNNKIEWNKAQNILLEKKYKKNTIAMAKKRMIENGEIEETMEDGKKYISILKVQNHNYFDETEFKNQYEEFLKEYFKAKIGENPRYYVLDVREFITLCPHLAELNDEIINNPFKARTVISNILKRTYKELGMDEDIENLKITFTNLVGRHKLLSQITSKDIGKLVEFEGAIIQSSKMMTRTTKATFLCHECGNTTQREIGLWDNPRKLKVPCKCGAQNMSYMEEDSEHTNFQELLIQQTEVSKDGKQHSATVFIEGMGKGIFSGRVKITAIPIKKSRTNSSVSDICLYGIYCEPIDEYEVNITEEDIEKIHKIAEDKNASDKLAQYMFRKIYGHDTIKKAIFLQQIKGAKKGDDKQNINILLITDPGSGKTTMMRELEKYPHVKYASLTTASGPGLTAAVVREKTEFGDGWVVKPGVYALADEGTACIDELTANKSVFPVLLEPLESQKITLDKAGINITLPARCATLAACNPKRGSFDPNLSVMEQIDIPSPLLDRFDLIFPLKRDNDLDKNRMLAKHIIKQGNNIIKGVKEKHEINGVELSIELVSKYIVYAEQIQPIIGEEAEKIIVDYYLKMIELSKGKSALPISPRQLQAILRLAEAHAKARLSDIVEEEDAREAVRIMDECLKEVAYDPETGSYDLGKMYGVPKSKAEKMDRVVEIIKELSETSDNELAHEDDIMEIAKEKYKISEEEVENILEMLKKSGEIYSPRFGYYKLT
ncbi:minichromosome maintenance protein MCM [Methanothermococcus sp.]|uniref:minichromosome maintenance protein MCM n=1 Tax=Methanothermococcus sp. TaxID=2614238 RepID=UPI0025E65ECF|nr:minichromosome maintenance protein MCM [Methanothermococcus sp.]